MAPLRTFVQHEPAPALRVLLAHNGTIANCLRAGFKRALEDNLNQPIAPDVLDIIVQLATAMEWAPIIIDEPPANERAIGLIRTLLQTTLAATPAASTPSEQRRPAGALAELRHPLIGGLPWLAAR